MEKQIAVLAGDGIGPEVMLQACRVLETIAAKFNHKFKLRPAFIGGVAYDHLGQHFPEETRAACAASDAILFGSVGGPISEAGKEKWKNCEVNSLLALRKTFRFHANFRPARVYTELAGICPLRPEVINSGVDLLIIRELIGDIYFGEHRTGKRGEKRYAIDVAEYDEDQVSAIARVAFDAARKRRNKVTSVDKANVLDTSKLWREIVHEVHQKDYKDVQLEDMLVDNCAMQLIRNPSQFDVIVTANLFGDILSDAAAVLPGSLGLTPSASLNSDGFGMYEPSGGSAPDIAGQGIANPIAQILSVAMLLRFSFGLNKESSIIEQAIEKALKAGFRTKDIYSSGTTLVGTAEMTDYILAEI